MWVIKNVTYLCKCNTYLNSLSKNVLLSDFEVIFCSTISVNGFGKILANAIWHQIPHRLEYRAPGFDLHLLKTMTRSRMASVLKSLRVYFVSGLFCKWASLIKLAVGRLVKLRSYVELSYVRFNWCEENMCNHYLRTKVTIFCKDILCLFDTVC